LRRPKRAARQNPPGARRRYLQDDDQLGRRAKDRDDGFRRSGRREHRYARGILLRAKGIRSGDDAALRESLVLFVELDCPYQAARSGWLLEGKDREEARLTFLGLGATQPA
jgi:hypothetical protein